MSSLRTRSSVTSQPVGTPAALESPDRSNKVQVPGQECCEMASYIWGFVLSLLIRLLGHLRVGVVIGVKAVGPIRRLLVHRIFYLQIYFLLRRARQDSNLRPAD